LELCSEGQALPPVGFIADLGFILTGLDRDARNMRTDANLKSWENMLRTYEDHVLGKVYADRSLDRAADVVRRLKGRDQARGLAYVIEQMRSRIEFPGMHVSPAVLKALLDLPGDEIIAQAWALMAANESDPLLEQMYQEMMSAFRLAADLLGTEDVFELEHGTALAEFGQRVALRQVIQATELIVARIPNRPPPLASVRREVPTQALDEDVYPVGGFASISNRGSIESLLHSQLALMEDDVKRRPDMFDIKFLRDELLYYSRDENQFLRRHRRFVIELDETLTAARFKDAAAPFQRIIFVLAAAVVIIRTAIEWLDRDQLFFQLIVNNALTDEIQLLQAVLRDEMQTGIVALAKPQAKRKDQANSPANLRFTMRPIDEFKGMQIQVGAAQPLGINLPVDATAQEDDVVAQWAKLISGIMIAWLRDS
jgi:hypothetical protein